MNFKNSETEHFLIIELYRVKLPKTVNHFLT